MAGCSRPSIPVVNQEKQDVNENIEVRNKEENKLLVGKPAPSFTAPAFYNGEFTEVNLEDYKGQWVMLCFYPGDFTFV